MCLLHVEYMCIYPTYVIDHMLNCKLCKIRLAPDQEEIKHLNAELNPICHLLALLRAHHILHVFRIRVKLRLFTKSQNNIMKYK